MLRRLTFSLLFLAVACPLATAGKASEPPSVFKKKLILNSINYLRGEQKQKPLSIARAPDIVKLPQAAPSLYNKDGAGAITGALLSTTSDMDFSMAVVVAWSRDAVAGSPNAHFGRIEDSGKYRIDNLDTGDYYVLAVADGYVPKFYNNVTHFDEASTVPVIADSVSDGIDFIMEKIQPGTGSITGIVSSENADFPVANAFISVFSPDNPFLYGDAVSNDDGSYKITGLKSSTYVAAAWAEGYLTEFFDNAVSFENATLIAVEEPNDTPGIDFSLSLGGVISGVITSDSGDVIAGAYVFAYQESGRIDPDDSATGTVDGWGFGYSDENGEYLITGLTEGEYLVSAQVWNQWYYSIEWYDNVPTLEEATPVPVSLGEETPGIDFQLSVPTTFGEISGHITDTQGEPIADAFVVAHAPFDPADGGVQVWAYAHTDKQGNYRIENLPNGSYLLSASIHVAWQFVQRFWPDAEFPEQAEPVVVDSSTDPVYDFVLPIQMGTASISGMVLSNTGDPLAYAFIEVRSADRATDVASPAVWAYANTDSNGFYKIDHLPAGTYFAQAQFWQGTSFGQQWYDHADDRAGATPIKLVDNTHRDDIDFDLTLRPYFGAIAGTVTDEVNGVPIARAYVEISPIHYDFTTAPLSVWSFYAVTNEQGNFQIEYLPEGEYLVSVYANGAFEFFQDAVVAELASPVKVVGGETTALNFGLSARNEGSGVISGTVTGDPQGGRLEIAVVIARPSVVPAIWPDSQMFFTAIVNPDGSYKMTGLPEGEYFLFSFAPGYIGEYYDNVFDPAEATLVKVDGVDPTTGIDFKLSPMYILEADGLARAQSGSTVFGKVTDSDGRGIQDANLYLLNNAEQPVSFARSNAEGIYELRNVPPGQYRLQATHLDYDSEYNDQAVDFSAAEPLQVSGGTVEVNFSLNPKTVTDVPDRLNPTIPQTVELYGNYPNPFNPATRISFGLPAQMHVKLRIFNLLGQEVAQLVDQVLGAGVHNVNWDGRNKFGQTMPSGIYFYILQAGSQRFAVNKMTLMK
ncbi:MAG: carboxypeptidase regulatory-like domain-containing protein [bacterium]